MMYYYDINIYTLVNVNKEYLWKLALIRSEQAISSKSIIPFKTNLHEFQQGKYNYKLVTLIGKLRTQTSPSCGPHINPFSPWEKDLEISKINNTHVLILNKYPVEIGHMLLITDRWQPQNGWLTLEDWEALVTVNKDTNGLWFFNNSFNAGASQPHRHLQLLRRTKEDHLFPRQQWFENQLMNESNVNNVIARSTIVKPIKNIKSAREINISYLSLCKKLKIGDPQIDSLPLKSYNILLTNKWISIITRSIESYKGFNINALGFAGYLLANKNSDVKWLMNNNAENLLENVVKTID